MLNSWRIRNGEVKLEQQRQIIPIAFTVTVLALVTAILIHVSRFSTSFNGSAFLVAIAFWGIVIGCCLFLFQIFKSLQPAKDTGGSYSQVEMKDDLGPVVSLLNEARNELPNSDGYQSLVKRILENDESQYEFLNKVSHDVRGSLACILGYAYLLAEPELKQDPLFFKTCLKSILDHSDRVSRLMNKVMVITALENGGKKVQMSPFSLSDVIEELVNETCQKSNRDIQLINQAGEATIYGDPIYIREAILNLLENAVEYSPPDQPVHVILRQTPEEDRFEIAVRDHGYGIEDADLPNLFTRFGRVQSGRNGKVGGSGLGLYIVKKVAEFHLGEVGVQSKPGEGSTFTIWFPSEHYA